MGKAEVEVGGSDSKLVGVLSAVGAKVQLAACSRT